MGHSHGSTDHHDHDLPKDFGRAFLIGIALNLGFVLVESVYGILSHSLSLLADAGHNFGDVIGLVLAWGASRLASKRPTREFTYGLKGTTILSSLMNALLLLVAVGAIVWEAVQRIRTPAPVDGSTVMIVAGVGIAINTFTALLFISGRKSDLNVRGAFMHMAADALVSLGVVLGGWTMLRTGWLWIDPAISLSVSVVIALGTFGILKESFKLSVQGVPAGVKPSEIQAYLQSQSGVTLVHDLHVWGMSTTESALTVHLVMPEGHPGDEFLKELAVELKEHHSVDHATIQIEFGSCELSCVPVKKSHQPV